MGNVIPIGRAKKGFSRAVSVDNLQALYEADLQRSCIPIKAAELLGFKLLSTPDELWAALNPRHGDERPADFTAVGYTIPYPAPDGSYLNFIRVRKLAGDFLGDSGRKYDQPPNSTAHPYVPFPLLNLPSPDKKTGKIHLTGEIIITEGEKKSVGASLLGIPTIALGGVWNFKSKKQHLLMLPELLEWFDWSEADVSFAFDVDVYGNDDVRYAMHQCKAAMRKTFKPKSLSTIELTAEATNDKIGLDDWLCACDGSPKKVLAAFQAIKRTPDPASVLFRLFNSQYTYSRVTSKFFDWKARSFKTDKAIVELAQSEGLLLRADGTEEISAVKLWMQDRDTRTTNAHDVLYLPGKESRFFADERDAEETCNMWRASTLEPIEYKGKKADKRRLALFLDYFDTLTQRLTDEERAWFLWWLSYPLRHVGAKMKSGAFLWSSRQQVAGKSGLKNILTPIYGTENVFHLDGSSLMQPWNSYVQSQLLFIEEVFMPSYGERNAASQRMKTLITENTVDLVQKYIPNRNVPNVCNVIATSNHENGLVLTPDDARLFVVHGPETKIEAWPKANFTQLYRWLRKEDGIAQVYGYLLSVSDEGRLPSDFPPKTEAWHSAANYAQGKDGPLGDVIKRLIDSPEDLMSTSKKKLRSRDLFEPQELVNAINAYAWEHRLQFRTALSTQILGQHLRNTLPKREALKVHGKQITLYAVFRRKEWQKADKQAWRKHLMDHT